MKEIKEIKSIEITLKEDYVFKIDFNGEKDEEGYVVKTTKDNAFRVARTLTRMADIFWKKFDIIANEENAKNV